MKMVKENQLAANVKKLRDFYACVPDSPILKTEFGFYCLDRWIGEGYLKPYSEEKDYNAYLRKVFGYDEIAAFDFYNLGWCEAAMIPTFEEAVLEDRGKYELVRDFAGRHVLYFKGRRNGFMPEYVEHPVKDLTTWKSEMEWRLNPATPERLRESDELTKKAVTAEKEGKVIIQHIVGGYMYLRSLIGPEDLLYKFLDDPGLIHACMQNWFELNDAIIARHQQWVSLDEVFIGEDICYNGGSLISPDMIKEFLFVYYRALLDNCRKRQLDKTKKLHFHVDTDGFCVPVIDLYETLGMTYMSPFEVASNCDVVEIGKRYPDLLISGGIDKRILAKTKDDIDRELERIMPAMKKRGGYWPTCDHGVPEEVSFGNYMHFRERLAEYAD